MQKVCVIMCSLWGLINILGILGIDKGVIRRRHVVACVCAPLLRLGLWDGWFCLGGGDWGCPHSKRGHALVAGGAKASGVP